MTKKKYNTDDMSQTYKSDIRLNINKFKKNFLSANKKYKKYNSSN